MKLLKFSVLLVAISCASDIVKKDGFDRFQNASSSGNECGRLLKKLPKQEGTTWGESSRQSVEFAFTTCLRTYSATDTHASSLEFFKGVFREMGLKFEEVGLANSARVIAYFEKTTKKPSVLIVHSTDVGNSQLVGQEGNASASMWGQQKNDVKSTTFHYSGI